MARKSFPIEPPVEPMLARLAEELPDTQGLLFEPKWDGFRAIVFRGAQEVFIQSRDARPFDRYFPDLHEALLEKLPAGCVLDGEIVIATPRGLDFDALQPCRDLPALAAGQAAARLPLRPARGHPAFRARKGLRLLEGIFFP